MASLQSCFGLAGLKKRLSSVVAALPGRQLKCSNFPGRKKEKRKKKRKEGENKGKKGREEEERKKEREVKGQNGVVYWERRRKRVKRNEGAWLATRKKIIFLGPAVLHTLLKTYRLSNLKPSLILDLGSSMKFFSLIKHDCLQYIA